MTASSEPTGLLRLSGAQWRFLGLTKPSIKLLSGGYGSGKTYAGIRQALIYAAENPGCHIGMVGPTWRQVDRDILRLFKQVLEQELGVEYKYNNNTKELSIPEWDWRFDLASAEVPDSIKGVTWAAAVGNEPGICPVEIHEVVLSRLRDSKARYRQLAYVGTPEGVGNWLGQRFYVKPIPGSAVVYTSTTDNPSCPPGFFKTLERSYDALLLQEKGHGRFVNTTGGRTYYAFTRDRNVDASLKCVPDVPWRIALDFNVDPYIASLCQVFDEGTPCPWGHQPTCIHVLREIVLNRADTAAMAAAIEAAVHPQEPWMTPVYPDATGSRETTAAVDGSDFAILRAAGFTDLRVSSTNPRQRDRVAVANGLFCNALGAPRLVYAPGCLEGIADRETLGWHNGKIDERDKKRTHASDGVDYLAWKECPLYANSGGGVAML